MANPNEPNSPSQRIVICLVLGLLAIAAVPGIGWLSGQFYETIALCIGIALLLYAVFAYISAVNTRLNALEQRLAERDRTRN
jgi:hypothetical protein